MHRVLGVPARLLPPLLLLVCVCASFLLADAFPAPSSVVVGVVLPLSGPHAAQGQRVQALLNLLATDINSGVAVGGMPSRFLGASTTLTLAFEDSGVRTIDALQSMNRLHATHGSNMMAVIGGFNDEEAIAMDFLALQLGLVFISPAATTASLSNMRNHPTFIRTSVSAVDIAQHWMRFNDENGWRRFGMITNDDDDGISYADTVLRLAATRNERLKAFALNGTTPPEVEGLFQGSEPFIIDSIVLPAAVTSTSLAAIDQAMDKLGRNFRVFLLHSATQAEDIFKSAAEHGWIGTGVDGVVRQWAGDFCTEELAARFQAEPLMLYGSTCYMPPLPRTRAAIGLPVNAEAVALQTRLRNADATLFPSSWQLTRLDVDAGTALYALVGVMGNTFADASLPNTAVAIMSQLTAISVVPPDGSAARTFRWNGDVNVQFLDELVWDMASKSYRVTAIVDLLADTRTRTGAPIVLGGGNDDIAKDRAHVYITGDALPNSFDMTMVILSFVVAMLGAWTALILLEQALSFWSRGGWKQAVGWVALASIALGGGATWPNAVMNLSALTLDVDAKLRLHVWAIVVSAIVPCLGCFGSLMLCIHGVDGGFKPASNTNVDRVSDLTDVSSQGSGTNSSKGSGTSATASLTRSANHVSRHKLKSRVIKRLQRFKESVITLVRQSGWQLLGASAVLMVTFVCESFILYPAFHVKASLALAGGPMAGAFFFSFLCNIPALAMYFHMTRSGVRYLAPFLLGCSMIGSFFILFDNVEWTYKSEVDITGPAIEGTHAADQSLAVIVAITCAVVCILLMVLNVHRLRVSRDVLDKVLLQVASQVRSIEADMESEKEMQLALSEQAAFFRRSLELINLCRPLWRPYAVALAMADPEDNVAEKPAAAANTLAPLEKDRKQLAPAGTKAKAAKAISNVVQEEKEASSAGSEAKGLLSAAGGKSILGGGAGAAGAEVSQHGAGAGSVVSDKGGDAAVITGSTTGAGAADKDKGPKLPGTILTPEQKVRKIPTAGKTVTIPSSSTKGADSASSSSAPAAASSSSDSSSSAASAGHIASDFLRVHAPKKEKQLVALLKEISDMHLENPPASKVVADIRLPQILSHPVTLELMKDVLAKNLSPENIALWVDIQRFRSLDNANVRKAVADEICQTYIISGAKFEVNLSSFMRDYVRTQVSKGASSLDLFEEVEREIYRLMITNNTEPLVQSNMFKLGAIVLGHPLYKLKQAKLENNTRGDVGGNVPVLFGTAAAGGGAAGQGLGQSLGMTGPSVAGSLAATASSVVVSVGGGAGMARGSVVSPSHGGTPRMAESPKHGGIGVGRAMSVARDREESLGHSPQWPQSAGNNTTLLGPRAPGNHSRSGSGIQSQAPM